MSPLYGINASLFSCRPGCSLCSPASFGRTLQSELCQLHPKQNAENNSAMEALGIRLFAPLLLTQAVNFLNTQFKLVDLRFHLLQRSLHCVGESSCLLCQTAILTCLGAYLFDQLLNGLTVPYLTLRGRLNLVRQAT